MTPTRPPGATRRGVPADRLDHNSRPPRGLDVVAGFVTAAEHDAIVDWVDTHVTWTSGSYHGNRLETWLDGHRPLPPWGASIGARLADAGVFPTPPDYLHLIDYPAGNGLPPHIDAADLGPTVAGLTLRSTRILELTHPRRRPVRVLLRPGDLYVLRGPARTRWHHNVPATPVDRFRGQDIARADGLSATWRHVDPDAPWAIALRAEPAATHPAPPQSAPAPNRHTNRQQRPPESTETHP